MAVDETKVLPPQINSNQPLPQPNIEVKPAETIKTESTVFPSATDQQRLKDYEYFNKLFLGKHFDAFNIRISDEQFTKAYAQLRYVQANFAGLISKIVADMLFSEPITVKVPDGDQDFVDALWRDNNMDAQCYESALSNSYQGDAVFKLRVGKRNPGDKENTVIIEDITPKIYFPKVDPFNVRAEPESVDLAWTFKVGDKTYLRKETHKAGSITNKVYLMEGNEIKNEEPLTILGNIPGLVAEQATKVEYSLVVHVPNWKVTDRFFGISDYYDLDSIFFAINNRLTKVDNILDKHGDPILMVPPGILDEKGQVKKKALGVIEMGEGENKNKPEYIVWDASLENAFKEIEKLVEFMYLIGEVSPDILGMGEGQTDSGRALKFKLMRTLAKTARKKLYYDAALKKVIYLAQLLAKAHNVKVQGKVLQGEPQRPEISWADGLPIDISEQLETEIQAVDAGLTAKRDAIMRIYEVDEKAAEEMLKVIEKEQPQLPEIGTDFKSNPFNKGKSENETGDGMGNKKTAEGGSKA